MHLGHLVGLKHLVWLFGTKIDDSNNLQVRTMYPLVIVQSGQQGQQKKVG